LLFRQTGPILGFSYLLVLPLSATTSTVESPLPLLMTGIVRDTSGLAIEAVRVVALQGDREILAQSDGRGTFRLELGPGAWTCVLSKEGFIERRVSLTLKEGDRLFLKRFKLEAVSGARVEVYAQGDEVTSLRTQIPMLEVPQAIQLVDQTLIQNTGITRMDKVYDHVSGISRQNSFGGLWDNYAIRGFSGNVNTGPNVLRNGFAGNRGFNAPRDMAAVERLEVLKGPSGALYGSGEPGGILNIITKKPTFSSTHSLDLNVGSFGFRRAALDSTAPLAENVAYRLNLAAEERDSFRDHIHSDRLVVAPTLSWIISPNTLLNYEMEYLRHRAPLDRGVVAVDGDVEALPIERFLGEPQDGDIRIGNTTHQLTLEHTFSATWKGRAGVSHRGTDLEGFSTEVRASNPLLWATSYPVIRRERRYRDYASEDTSFQAEASGRAELAGRTHEFLLGGDAYVFHLNQFMSRWRPSSTYGINIFNPVYGEVPGTLTPSTDTRERQHNTGFFAQDQVALSTGWRLMVGLRMDLYRQRLHNDLTDSTTQASENVITPRLGLTWLASPSMSFYAMYSGGFAPNAGVDAQGAAFPSERSRAQELGFKLDRPGRHLTLALFNIDKSNILTTDPSSASDSIAAGKANSRGLELDARVKLSERVKGQLSYAYTRTRIAEDSNAAMVGVPLINTPRHSGSALLMYEQPLSDTSGYGFGGGVTHVGTRSGNSVGTFELPAYTTVQAMAYWQVSKRLRLSGQVDNLFQEQYYASSYDICWVTPGSPRSFSLSCRYQY